MQEEKERQEENVRERRERLRSAKPRGRSLSRDESRRVDADYEELVAGETAVTQRQLLQLRRKAEQVSGGIQR